MPPPEVSVNVRGRIVLFVAIRARVTRRLAAFVPNQVPRPPEARAAFRADIAGHGSYVTPLRQSYIWKQARALIHFFPGWDPRNMKVTLPETERHRNAAKRYDSNAVACGIESCPESCYFTLHHAQSVRQFVVAQTSREDWKSASLTTLRGVFGSCFAVQKKITKIGKSHTWLQNAQHWCVSAPWGVVKHDYTSLFPFVLFSSNQATCNKYGFYSQYIFTCSFFSVTLLWKLRIHVNLNNTKQKRCFM